MIIAALWLLEAGHRRDARHVSLRRPVLAGAISALALFTPREARPQEAPYALTYSAPEGCPSASEFSSEVAARVPDPSVARSAVLDAKLSAEDTAVIGELTVTSPSGVTGQRRVDGRTCDDVFRALVFIASVAINLGGHVDEPSPAPAPVPPPPPPARPPPPPPPPPAPPPPRALDLSLDIAAGFVTALAPAPRPTGEIGVAIGDPARRIVAPWGRLSFGAAWSQVELLEGTAELWLLHGRVEACPFLFAISTVSVRPCGAFEIGPLFARGLDIDQARSETSLWMAPSALLRIEWAPSPHFFVEAEGGAAFPLQRARYVFGQDTTVHTLPVALARATLGAGYKL